MALSYIHVDINVLVNNMSLDYFSGSIYVMEKFQCSQTEVLRQSGFSQRFHSIQAIFAWIRTEQKSPKDQTFPNANCDTALMLKALVTITTKFTFKKIIYEMLHSECKWRHKACPREITAQAESGANVWKPDITAKLRNSVYLEGTLA